MVDRTLGQLCAACRPVCLSPLISQLLRDAAGKLLKPIAVLLVESALSGLLAMLQLEHNGAVACGIKLQKSILMGQKLFQDGWSVTNILPGLQNCILEILVLV